MDKECFDVVIESEQGAFSSQFKGLWRYKDLIFLFVKREFVSKYKQTILGPAWAVIQPLLTTVVFTVIFGNVAGLGASGVPSFAFYFSGTFLWTFFSGCLTSTANTFISNSGVMGKVYFPRLVMPISTVLSQMISLGIQFAMFIVFDLYYLFTGQGVKINLFILMTPLLFAQLAMLALGFGVIISALTTKYRDLIMLVSFIVELWKYMSPIAYDMFNMGVLAPGGRFYALYMLNPATPIVNVFRFAYLGIGQIDWLFYVVSWITTIVLFIIGVFMFNKVERTFMDTI